MRDIRMVAKIKPVVRINRVKLQNQREQVLASVISRDIQLWLKKAEGGCHPLKGLPLSSLNIELRVGYFFAAENRVDPRRLYGRTRGVNGAVAARLCIKTEERVVIIGCELPEMNSLHLLATLLELIKTLKIRLKGGYAPVLAVCIAQQLVNRIAVIRAQIEVILAVAEFKDIIKSLVLVAYATV